MSLRSFARVVLASSHRDATAIAIGPSRSPRARVSDARSELKASRPIAAEDTRRPLSNGRAAIGRPAR